MSQKGHWTTKKKNQNWINIYLCFSISSHGNHGKLLLFPSYESQGIQTKNAFDEIVSLSFDSSPLKMNTYGIRQESILQRTIKRTHILKHILWEKIKRIKNY
jgi:hypothetical protein